MKKRLMLGLIVFTSILSSCSKSERQEKNSISPIIDQLLAREEDEEKDDTIRNSYIYLHINENIGGIDDDTKKSVNMVARFEDAHEEPFAVGDITFDDDIVVSPDSDNQYCYYFKGAQQRSKTALGGNMVKFAIKGSSLMPAWEDTIYLPKMLEPNAISLVSPTISNDNDRVVNWVADPNNRYRKVGIQVEYYAHMSQIKNPSMPANIQSLVYLTPDDGQFVIPASDLSRFPDGSWVRIYIIRATSKVTSNTTPSFRYLATSQASTMPMLVE